MAWQTNGVGIQVYVPDNYVAPVTPTTNSNTPPAGVAVGTSNATQLPQGTVRPTDKTSGFSQSLQYLVDQQNQQKLLDQQAATQRYQNLLTQIEQQKAPVQQQYQSDARQAYVNKVMAQDSIGANLNRLGLNTQGFAIGEQNKNEATYSQNLGGFQSDRNNAILGLNNQAINATGELNANMLSLESDYAGRAAELSKYINETTMNQKEKETNAAVDAQKYKDDLAQRAWENEYANKQLAEQKRATNLSAGGGGGGFTDTNTTSTAGPVVKTDYYNGAANADAVTNGAIDKSKVFSNGYQPNNIAGTKVTALSKAGKTQTAAQYYGKTGMKNSSGVVIDNQKIWTIGSNYYVWNGSTMKYEQIAKKK